MRPSTDPLPPLPATFTAAQHRVWHAHLESLRQTFAAAAAERDQRQDPVETLDANGKPASELGWVVHEWEVMHAEVNRLRAQAGLGPIDIYAVRCKETMALGHSDYATKFAIGCADLVVAGDPRFAA